MRGGSKTVKSTQTGITGHAMVIALRAGFGRVLSFCSTITRIYVNKITLIC